MKISHKGKHNFWAQFLFGIVTLFVSSSQLPYYNNTANPCYQNTQQQIQTQVRFVSTHAEQIQQQNLPRNPQSQSKKFFQNIPHFVGQNLFAHAFIRAGPILA